MNRFIKTIILIGLFSISHLWGQFESPVTLSAKAESSVRAGEVVNIIVKAEMDAEWKIYALRDQGEGPIATRVVVTGEIIEASGLVWEDEPVKKYDDGFLTTTRTHQGGAIFKAPILVKSDLSPGKYNLSVNVLFQVCNASLCYPPKEEVLTITVTVEGGTARDDRTDMVLVTDVFDDFGNINLDAAIDEGFFSFVILAFSMGLLALLTPCVFPMIPILSSILVAQGGSLGAKRGFLLSLVYVLSMGIAYTIAGVLAGVFGANIQAMLQNRITIYIFCAIFILLALSMFGFFEIGLPSSLQSKLAKTSDDAGKKGGFVGSFVMGFLSALIVGPCVAPPLAGALMYIGQTGNAFLGGFALFAMSIGMGSPLLLIGLGAGKYMPKPGGWMNIVSKVFGVVMLAIAIWMLDRIVPFVVTMWLTVILAMGSAFYLIKYGNKFGKIVAVVLMIGSSVFVMQTTKQTQNKNHHYIYVKNLEQLDHIVATSKQPIMLDFWATWCVSCKELDNITFKDPKVLQSLKGYLLLKVDVTNNTQDDKALMKRFNLFGPPALIFFKNGKELKNKRIICYKSPDEFLEIIK